MLTACAGFLADCAASSSNTTALNAPEYTSSGAVDSYGSSASSSTAFAPTAAAAAHSTAASEAADKLTSAARPGNSAYMIGPLDVLDVQVFKVPDLAKTVQVADDGTINYPLIGDIHAAGKTAKQLEQELTQKLGAKYLRDPQVTVLIKEYNSQRVTVEGSVKTSGVYGIKGTTSLMQILAMAGGIDDNTASGAVVVFRTIDDVRSVARFDTDAIKKGTAEDPELAPGDVIVVDTSATKVAMENILKVVPLATTAAIFSGL